MTPQVAQRRGSVSGLPRRSAAAWVGVVALALVASWGATYALGGAGAVAPHWFYIPIILAASRFGPAAAAVTALLAGLLAGPLMPADVAEGLPQPVSDWGSRSVFFLLIGLFVSFLIERRKQAEGQILRRAERLRSLHEIDVSILRADSLPELARGALSRLRILVPAERAAVNLFDLDRGEATVLALEQAVELGPEEGTTFAAGEVLPAERLRAGEVIHSPDLGSFPGRWTLLERLHAAGVRSFLAAPLISTSGPVGLLTLSSSRPDAFDREHEEIAREVAYQLAVALQQARLREELAAQAQELGARLDQLRASDGIRRDLLAQLVGAEERERERIAEDIHDDPIQKMTAVGMRLRTLSRRLGHPEALDDLAQLEETVRRAIERLRALMFDLHPSSLELDGLAAAVREHLHRLEGELSFDLEDRLTQRPPREVTSVAYRIALEAIANARKHARAHRVSVRLEEREGGLLVRVGDDGRGFIPGEAPEDRPGHLGLASMRQRAELAGGWVRLDSAPGRGTTVEAWLPFRGSGGRSVGGHGGSALAS